MHLFWRLQADSSVRFTRWEVREVLGEGSRRHASIVARPAGSFYGWQFQNVGVRLGAGADRA